MRFFFTWIVEKKCMKIKKRRKKAERTMPSGPCSRPSMSHNTSFSSL